MKQVPPYLNSLGLARAPFANDALVDFYFEDPAFCQRLDLLQHLLMFGRDLLIVRGECGSGKTTLVYQLLQRAQENWKVCSIQGHDKVQPAQLIGELIRQLDVVISRTDPKQAFASIEKKLSMLVQVGHTPILLIDDAHLLSLPTLKVVIDLFNIKDDPARIHRVDQVFKIVLFVDNQYWDRLFASPTFAWLRQFMRTLDMPLLSNHLTKDYLQHRLAVAGLRVGEPLSDSAIKRIAGAANGFPAMVNALAHQVLLSPRQQAGQAASTAQRSSKLIALLQSIGAVLGIIVLIGVLVFQDKINGLFSGGGKQTRHGVVDLVPLPERDVVTLDLVGEKKEGAANAGIDKDANKKTVKQNPINEADSESSDSRD